MSIEENEQLAEDFVKSWGSHDADKTIAFMADGSVWNDVSIPEPMRDRAMMRAYVQGWNTAFPDMAVRVVNKLATADQLAAQVEFSGTNTGPMQMGPASPSLPATGKKVLGKGTLFARVRDGKVAELHTYPDIAGVMMQLGVMPPPAP